MKTLATAVLLLLTSCFVSADTLVVPNSKTSTTGNISLGLTNPSSFEFQESFGRGQFPSGSILITQVAFRAAPGTGPVDVTVDSFAISLSTSPYAPNSAGGNTLITSNYTTNLGPDNTLVFSGGAGTFMSSSGCSSPGPCPFDIVFNLNTPFLYNPQNGFLLLDAQFTGWSGTGQLDAEGFNSPGGSLAIVDSSDKVDLGGQIVQFSYTAVPEPSSIAFLATGLAAIGGTFRRKFHAL